MQIRVSVVFSVVGLALFSTACAESAFDTDASSSRDALSKVGGGVGVVGSAVDASATEAQHGCYNEPVVDDCYEPLWSNTVAAQATTFADAKGFIDKNDCCAVDGKYCFGMNNCHHHANQFCDLTPEARVVMCQESS